MRWVNVLNACFNGIWYALSGIMDVLRNGEIYLLIFWRVIISLWIIEMSTYHPLPVPVVMQYHTIPFIDSAIHRWCGYLPPPPGIDNQVMREECHLICGTSDVVFLYLCTCALFCICICKNQCPSVPIITSSRLMPSDLLLNSSELYKWSRYCEHHKLSFLALALEVSQWSGAIINWSQIQCR